MASSSWRRRLAAALALAAASGLASAALSAPAAEPAAGGASETDKPGTTVLRPPNLVDHGVQYTILPASLEDLTPPNTIDLPSDAPLSERVGMPALARDTPMPDAAPVEPPAELDNLLPRRKPSCVNNDWCLDW